MCTLDPERATFRERDARRRRTGRHFSYDEKQPSTIRNRSRDRGVPVTSNSRAPAPSHTLPRASTCPPRPRPPSPSPSSSRAPASTAGTSSHPPPLPRRRAPAFAPSPSLEDPDDVPDSLGGSFLSLRGLPRPPSRMNSSRVARRATTRRGTPCACAVERTPTRAGRSVPPRSEGLPLTLPRRRPGRARATRNRRTSACARASRGGEKARRVISGGDRRAARTASRTPPRVSRRVPGCDSRAASVTTSRGRDAEGRRGWARGRTRARFYSQGGESEVSSRSSRARGGLRKDTTLVLEHSSLVHGSSPAPSGPKSATSSSRM